MCKRGDIYFVDFGQNIESNKQCGIRPAVIVSNNRANEHSPVITVVPLTGRTYKKRFLPTHVFIPRSCGLDRNSLALAEQVEAIDKKNLLEKRILPSWRKLTRLSRYSLVWTTDIIKNGS